MTKVTYLKLTNEEKARWQPMFLRCWDAIAYDAIECCGGECTADEAVEFATDAHRVEIYGGMTHEEYVAFCRMDPKETDPWLRTFFEGTYVP